MHGVYLGVRKRDLQVVVFACPIIWDASVRIPEKGRLMEAQITHGHKVNLIHSRKVSGITLIREKDILVLISVFIDVNVKPLG